MRSVALAAAAGVDPKTARKAIEHGVSIFRVRAVACAIDAAASKLGIKLGQAA
jgi:hypothetical protein